MSDIIATDEIRDVGRLFRDGGDWTCKCPHCGEFIGLEGDTLDDVRGEQFQHRRRAVSYGNAEPRYIGCGGWLQVSSNARHVQPPGAAS